MTKIKLDHVELDHPAYLLRMKELSTAIAVAPALVALVPKLAPFNTAVGVLETKFTTYQATMNLGKQQLVEVQNARAITDGLVGKLANASEGETSDDAELKSGAWHLRGPRGPVGPMPAPQNVNCTGGDLTGEVDSSFDPAEGRNSYIGEHAPSPTGPWTQCYIGKKSSCTASGLVSGQLYYFRFAAVGTTGQGPWSDPASKRAT